MLNPNDAIALVGFAAWAAVIVAAVVCFILGFVESRPVRRPYRRPYHAAPRRRSDRNGRLFSIWSNR